MPSPSIILIHGVCHTPTIWSSFEPLLHKEGFRDTLTIHLPSSGTEPVTTSRDPDIAAVRSSIQTKLSEKKDVLIIAHSWGGVVVCDAVKGLPSAISSPQETEAEGVILGIIFLASPLPFLWKLDPPLAGASTKESNKSESSMSHIRVSGPLLTCDNDPSRAPATLFYNDLPPSTQEHLVSQLVPHSLASLAQKTKYVPFMGDFDCTYVICANDNILPVAVQERLVKQVGVKFKVVRVESGHSVMVSRPEVVLGVVREVGGRERGD